MKDTNGYRGKGDEKASYNNHGKVAHGYWDTHLAFAPDAVDPKSDRKSTRLNSSHT